VGCDYAAGVGLLVLQEPFCFLGHGFEFSWKYLQAHAQFVSRTVPVKFIL